MKYFSNKNVNKMISGMVTDGWGYYWPKHNRLVSPFNGKTLFFSRSPSDYRVVQKMKSDIRKLHNG
jgi:hypothetical protein